MWDGGIPRPPDRRPRPAASLRFLRAALEKRFTFPQLRTLAGSNPSVRPQEKPPDRLCVREVCFFGWDGGIRTPTAGTKNRSSTVELRPNVSVA